MGSKSSESLPDHRSERERHTCPKIERRQGVRLVRSGFPSTNFLFAIQVCRIGDKNVAGCKRRAGQNKSQDSETTRVDIVEDVLYL